MAHQDYELPAEPGVGGKTNRLKPTECNAGAISNVAQDAAASSDLSAANVDRRGWYVFNDTTGGNLLVAADGSDATTDNWTFAVPPGEGREFPSYPAIYTGKITGIWDAAGSGKARVTEWSQTV